MILGEALLFPKSFNRNEFGPIYKVTYDLVAIPDPEHPTIIQKSLHGIQADPSPKRLLQVRILSPDNHTQECPTTVVVVCNFLQCLENFTLVNRCPYFKLLLFNLHPTDIQKCLFQFIQESSPFTM